MLADQAIAGIVRATGVPLEYLFLTGYALSLALIWTGIVLIGGRLYRYRWTTVALGLAFTLRHRIARTSANSFEPYFHPRMLAFGICLLALAAVLRRRWWLATGLVAIGALVHITTALWFAVMLGAAIVIMDRRWRVAAGLIATVGVLTASGVVAAGALRDRLVQMDGAWLEAVAAKDSLFATQWPPWTWAVNLGALALLLTIQQRRRRGGQSTPETAALVWGAGAVVALFVVTLPLVAWRVALPVQLQMSRVFWLVDFLATAWLIGEIADRSEHRARLAVLIIAFAAVARGAYGLGIQHQDRSLVEVHLADSRWHDAIAWLRRQPRDIHVLADPGHAWKYGTSVRVSAERDVFLEEQKDSAIAMYSRDVALRVVERVKAVGDFNAMTAERAKALSARYDIDYLVTEAPMPALREVYRNDQFHIYAMANLDR